VDVLATDLAVTALAARAPLEPDGHDDAALRMLEAWAADIDARPIAVEVAAPEPASVGRRPRGTKRSVAAMTIALTLSSTGIAAAVQGNPFGPIHYVVDKFGHLGPHDQTSPVDLLGTRSAPVSDARQKDARIRAEHDGRPSRSRSPHPPASGVRSDAQASAPIVAHRVAPSSGSSSSSGSGQAPAPRHRQRPLVVRHPGHPRPVVSPKPQGGETPPNRPEQPAVPSNPQWPKPSQVGPPAPPDKPMASAPGSAPVR
jgi:hypothetical protein